MGRTSRGRRRGRWSCSKRKCEVMRSSSGAGGRPKIMSVLRALRNWLDERFGWEELLKPLRKKAVPRHRLSYWYFLGGITLFLFVIQVLTGILLLLYYRPGANEAFESVQYIMTQVQFGWLIRSIHSWSAN